MSLNLTKNSLRIDAAVGTASIQAICKATMQLSEDKPDIDRILAPRAEAKIDSSTIKVADGKVSVAGNVRVELPYVSVRSESYVSDREPIRFAILDDAEFQADLVVPGAQSGMKASIDAEVDSFEIEMAGPRAVTLTAIVKLAAKVTESTNAELITDIGEVDAELVNLTKRSVFVESVIGDKSTEVVVRDAFQVPDGKPDIAELLDYTAVVTMSEDGLKYSPNKVVVPGILDLRIAYIGDIDEKPIEFLVGPEIDFTAAVDLNGVTEGSRTKAKGKLSSLTLTKVGSRTLQVEAVIDVDTQATAIAELTAVTDIEAKAAGSVDVLKTHISMESLVGQLSNQLVVSETFALGAGKVSIDEIFMASAKARITDVKLEPNKVCLTGEADVYVTYAGTIEEEGQISSLDTAQQLGLPFEVSMEISGVEPGMSIFAACDVIDVDAVKAGPRAIDVDIKINASIKVTEDEDMDVISDAAFIEATPVSRIPNRRMTIYVVQHGDSLWKVARRYNKTTGKIAEVNGVSDGQIYPGLKLIIPA